MNDIRVLKISEVGLEVMQAAQDAVGIVANARGDDVLNRYEGWPIWYAGATQVKVIERKGETYVDVRHNVLDEKCVDDRVRINVSGLGQVALTEALQSLL